MPITVTGPLPARGLVSTVDTSVSLTPDKVGTIDECETSEKDALPELLSAGTKGMLKYL